MPTPTPSPVTLGREILATLRLTGRQKAYDVALASGLVEDTGWLLFQAALDTIPKSQIIRVRGCGGFLQAA